MGRFRKHCRASPWTMGGTDGTTDSSAGTNTRSREKATPSWKGVALVTTCCHRAASAMG